MFPHKPGTPNSKGTPPADQIPCFTASARNLKCAVAGDASVNVFATPIWGLLRISPSEYPAPLYIIRLWAASTPFQYSLFHILHLVYIQMKLFFLFFLTIKDFRSLKENLIIELKRRKGIIPGMKKDRRDNKK